MILQSVGRCRIRLTHRTRWARWAVRTAKKSPWSNVFNAGWLWYSSDYGTPSYEIW